MTNTEHYSEILGKGVCLLIMAVLFVGQSTAQKELQIMVSGPWSYAADPNQPSRIFLVAPPSNHHRVYILPGPDAANFSGAGITADTYTLDFGLRGTYHPGHQDAPLVRAPSVNLANVNTILSNQSRRNYVISLPKPNAYTTYIDPAGIVEGYSESKVSTSDPSVGPSVPPALYTTWMVLHYGVSELPDSLTLKTATQNLPGVKTTDSAGKSGGISIVLGDPDIDDSDLCDSVSLESFNDRKNLWGLTEYARFPAQDKGKQRHYQYDYENCSTTVPAVKANEMEKPPFHMMAVGGADCHTAQMSINNVVPQ